MKDYNEYQGGSAVKGDALRDIKKQKVVHMIESIAETYLLLKENEHYKVVLPNTDFDVDKVFRE